MSKIEVCRCDCTNLYDIINLENEFVQERYSREIIEKSLSDKNVINLIIKYNGESVGYLSASLILDECELLKIVVASKYRRMGLGYRLLEELIVFLQSNKFHKIFLEVRADNFVAKSFYEKNGFEKINQRKKYYNDGVDADIYWLNLNVKN